MLDVDNAFGFSPLFVLAAFSTSRDRDFGAGCLSEVTAEGDFEPLSLLSPSSMGSSVLLSDTSDVGEALDCKLGDTFATFTLAETLEGAFVEPLNSSDGSTDKFAVCCCLKPRVL